MLSKFWTACCVLAATLAFAPAALAQSPIVTLSPSLEIHIGPTAPPRQRVEIRPTRPARGYSWVRGTWALRGSEWVWLDGRWHRPERPGVRWIQARSNRYGGSWRHYPGHWSDQRVIFGADYRAFRDARQKRHKDNRKEIRRGHSPQRPGVGPGRGKAGKPGKSDKRGKRGR